MKEIIPFLNMLLLCSEAPGISMVLTHLLLWWPQKNLAEMFFFLWFQKNCKTQILHQTEKQQNYF
jgi:hypothetical protein